MTLKTTFSIKESWLSCRIALNFGERENSYEINLAIIRFAR